MNLERAILVTFLGTNLINTVAASLVALIPAGDASGYLTPQYISFGLLAVAIVVALAFWQNVRGLRAGITFGVVGVVVSILWVFIQGTAGVLGQTGSFSEVVSILPNFWPFIWSVPTLLLVGYWLIPSIIIGYLKGKGMPNPAPSASASI